MRSLTKKMHKGQKGLTLIELLIVVAILGIIAAVVIPNLGGFMTTGRISAANTELENVKTAALAFYAEYEYWPGHNPDGADAQADWDILEEDFLAGETKANYTFTDAGWIRGLIGDTHDWGTTIDFEVDGDAPASHGKWVRA